MNSNYRRHFFKMISTEKANDSSAYKYTDITDVNNNQNESLSTLNEWSVNFADINPDKNFIAPSNLSKVYFHTIKYSGGCLYLWIGDQSAKLESLSCSMKTPFLPEPLTTALLSSRTQSECCVDATNDLACKLAKRLKKQVLLSLSVSFSVINNADVQDTCLKLIEMALFKEIALNPHKF